MHTLLKQRLEEGTLPSTLLFAGPRKEVNLERAKEFVKLLIGPSSKIDSGNHPDIHIYTPEVKSGLHSIESLRILIQEMAFPPFEASHKIFIIDEAEKMLPSGSNLLLKTLEEPPPDALIVLLTSQPEALLPTIRSRATPFTFASTTSQLTTGLFSTLLELALTRDYFQLIQTLEAHQEEISALNSEELLEQLFPAIAQCSPKKGGALLEELRIAEQYNIKRRTLLLNFYLNLF